jgi:hypothetical protein
VSCLTFSERVLSFALLLFIFFYFLFRMYQAGGLSRCQGRSNTPGLSSHGKDASEFVEADETEHQRRNNQAGGHEQADDLEVAGRTSARVRPDSPRSDCVRSKPTVIAGTFPHRALGKITVRSARSDSRRGLMARARRRQLRCGWAVGQHCLLAIALPKERAHEANHAGQCIVASSSRSPNRHIDVQLTLRLSRGTDRVVTEERFFG